MGRCSMSELHTACNNVYFEREKEKSLHANCLLALILTVNMSVLLMAKPTVVFPIRCEIHHSISCPFIHPCNE